MGSDESTTLKPITPTIQKGEDDEKLNPEVEKLFDDVEALADDIYIKIVSFQYCL